METKINNKNKNDSINNNFCLNELVFAKVKGHPFWPARIIKIDKETYKTCIKYDVIFFGTKQLATLSSTDLCIFSENKDKYPVEKVASKYKDNYKIALQEINLAWKSTKPTPKQQSNYQTTPRNSNYQVFDNFFKSISASAPKRLETHKTSLNQGSRSFQNRSTDIPSTMSWLQEQRKPKMENMQTQTEGEYDKSKDELLARIDQLINQQSCLVLKCQELTIENESLCAKLKSTDSRKEVTGELLSSKNIESKEKEGEILGLKNKLLSECGFNKKLQDENKLLSDRIILQNSQTSELKEKVMQLERELTLLKNEAQKKEIRDKTNIYPRVSINMATQTKFKNENSVSNKETNQNLDSKLKLYEQQLNEKEILIIQLKDTIDEITCSTSQRPNFNVVHHGKNQTQNKIKTNANSNNNNIQLKNKYQHLTDKVDSSETEMDSIDNDNHNLENPLKYTNKVKADTSHRNNSKKSYSLKNRKNSKVNICDLQKPMLIFSDSMFKHVDISEAEIKVYRGINADDMCHKIQESNNAFSKPKLIVINVGTNDLYDTKNADDVMGKIYNVLRTSKKCFPSSVTVINSIVQRRDIHPTLIHQANSNIRWLCRNHQAIYLDTCKYFTNKCLARDGVHPNRRGSAVLSKVLNNAYFICKKMEGGTVSHVVKTSKTPRNYSATTVKDFPHLITTSNGIVTKLETSRKNISSPVKYRTPHRTPTPCDNHSKSLPFESLDEFPPLPRSTSTDIHNNIHVKPSNYPDNSLINSQIYVNKLFNTNHFLDNTVSQVPMR